MAEDQNWASTVPLSWIETNYLSHFKHYLNILRPLMDSQRFKIAPSRYVCTDFFWVILQSENTVALVPFTCMGFKPVKERKHLSLQILHYTPLYGH